MLLRIKSLFVDGKKSITAASLHKALDIVYPGELAKHAWNEAAKAQESDQDNNGLVFPTDLLRNIMKTKYATTGY